MIHIADFLPLEIYASKVTAKVKNSGGTKEELIEDTEIAKLMGITVEELNK